MSAAQSDSRILRGMETQLALRRDRLNAGEKSIGWKVGFGTPAVMERLGTDAPLVGFLTDKTLLSSGATVAIGGWTNPAAEPEIAVHFGQDLSGVVDRERAQTAIASVGPAIELADINYPPDDVEAILAGNIYNRHVILGRADASRAGCVLDGLVGHVYHNGAEIAAVTDPQAVTGNLVDIVQHVVSLLAVFGEKVTAGEVIITGSLVPPIGLFANDDIRYALDPVDTLTVYLGA